MSALEPITEDWMVNTLRMVSDSYPMLGEDDEGRRRKAKVWSEELQDLHRTDVGDAVRTWIGHSPKPPSLADIRSGAIQRQRQRAQTERSSSFMGGEATFRCHRCKDTGWIELDEKAMYVDRCDCQPKEVLARYRELRK